MIKINEKKIVIEGTGEDLVRDIKTFIELFQDSF